MRRTWIQRLGGSTLAVVLASASGCTHYHYYGGAAPTCETPTGIMSGRRVTVHPYGSVCEVPPEGAGTLASSGSGGTQILVSQPQGARRMGGGSRFAWRQPDPDTLATTRIEGQIDESSVK